MNSLNRIKGPKITEIRNVSLPKVHQFELSNGIPVFEVNGGVQDVVKIEIVFQAGRPFESKKMLSKATSYLIKEGSKNRTSAEIANDIDFYGATLRTSTNLDDTRIILYSLKKYLKIVASVVEDILMNAIFPQNELDNYINNSIQNLNIDLSKDDFRAYRILTENIFGPDHPYGYNSSETLYKGLDLNGIKGHYKRMIGAQSCSVFLSGKIDQEVRDILEQTCGKLVYRDKMEADMGEIQPGEKISHIYVKDSHQTSIKMGSKLFNRNHEDYSTMFFLSTLLGGYFGSRLMTNLREEKGYTYSIYAGLDDFVYDGYFYISADVGNDYVKDSIKEINKELMSLLEIPVAAEEIKMVRNYLMGSLLNMLDGPFNQSQVVRTLITKQSPLDSFDRFAQDLLDMTSEKLQSAAQKYFNPDSMFTVLVGGGK